MSKNLSEMTLEELWRLFPISLSPHDPQWTVWYAEEAALLRALLPPEARLHHIGSTAIAGIRAKPIVDILAEVAPESVFIAAETLARNGYIIMSQSDRRVSLNKGYTPDGFAERVFHLHIRAYGDADEVLFRDYLIAHPSVAAEYERLKLRLWKRFEFDRDGYTSAKTEFVKRYTDLAKRS